MPKVMMVSCDSCSRDIAKEPYMVLTIHAVSHGAKTRMPTIYLCRNCYKRIPLSVMMFDTITEQEDKHDAV